MAFFKDAAGQEWTIVIDAPLIREIRNEFDGLDLIDSKAEGILRITQDPILLVDVLWVICREQARARGLSDVQFGRNLVGDPISQAVEALQKAILDFFPKSKREALTRILARMKEVEEKAIEAVMARVDDPELVSGAIRAVEARMDRDIAALLTQLSSATNSPDSAESPPEGSLGKS